MNRTIEKTIKSLREQERDSDKEGYKGDATSVAVYRHILILLEEQIINQKRIIRKLVANSNTNRKLTSALRNSDVLQKQEKD